VWFVLYRQVRYILVSLPSQGILELRSTSSGASAAKLSVGDSFSQHDINTGRVTYVHNNNHDDDNDDDDDDNERRTMKDRFVFRLSNGTNMADSQHECEVEV